jgi:hypothetical protein
MRHTLSILLLLLGINPIIAQTSLTTYSTTICSGGNAIVTATNLDQTVTFIWTSFNGQPSQTGNFLNVASATQSDTWTCTTNNTNSQPIDSDIFTVTVNNVSAGALSQTQTICSGGDANPFTVTTAATGTGTLSYQWQSSTISAVAGFNDIVGATSATYDPPAGQTLTTYFRLIVTSTLNGIVCTSTSAVLIVFVNNISPSVITNGQTICSGGNPVAFTVTTAAAGTGTLSYQWQSSTISQVAGFTNIANAIQPAYDAPAGLTVTTYYQVIITSTLNGVPCTAISNPLTVFVNTINAQTIAANQTICSNGDPVPFTVTTASSGSGSLSYQWQSSTTSSIAGYSNIIGATISTYDPPAGITVSTYYQVITSSTLNGITCTATSNPLTVTVAAVPFVLDIVSTICSGNPFTISPTNGAGNTVPSGTTYSWTNPTVTLPILGGSVQNNQANISQTLTNPTNVAQTATYTVTPLSGICQGNNFQVVVTVNPLPVLTTPSANQTICGGTPTTLTSFSNSVAGGAISWTLSNPLSVPGTITGYPTTGNGQIPVSAINNTGTALYILSYQVTPTANGCSGSAGTYTITVNPLPDSTITPNGATTFCSGGSVALSAIPNYSSYTWNKNGIVIPGAASATYFATQSGVYSVSITNQYSCNSMESITVNNLTIPVAAVSNASPANFFCQGNNTTLNASANCQGCNLSYQWLVNGTNTPETNPSLIVNTTGNYSVVIGNSLNGIACLDTSNNIFITSVQIVPPSFAGLPDSICVNETFVLPQLSNNNIAGTWNPLIISNQSSSYTFTPLLGQCASPYSWNVQLVALPQPSLGNDLVICAGDSTILISQGFNSYLWSNGSSDSSITVAPSATTQYILSVTNSFGCVGADSINVAVNPEPPLPFISGSESLCLNSLNQVYSTTPTVNWLIWNIDGANIYSGQYTNEVHLDLTSSDTLWINLTEHILNTGCYSTNTLMVLVDTNASAPPYVNVLPLGNQNDFLCAPQAIGIFRWGKIDKNTNDIYFYPSVYTYHNFTALDTANYFYFVDHGEIGCFTRSYYVYPQLITSTEELSASTYWLSPNPVINELSINSAKTELVWVIIENLEGKLVFKEEVWTNNPINCSSFINGMYFVRIEKAAALNFVKFLKF